MWRKRHEMADLLIYELLVAQALEKGLKPILAGRREEPLRAQAEPLGLQWRVSDLSEAALDAALVGVGVVVHAAGPFSRTAKPMIEACIRNKATYLDITGEIVVFEMAARYDKKALEAGVTVMPGVGFDVVPSDCLAAHLKRRLPSATHLTLGFQSTGRTSHGTATTMVENLDAGGAVRRDGKIIPVPSAYLSVLLHRNSQHRGLHRAATGRATWAQGEPLFAAHFGDCLRQEASASQNRRGAARSDARSTAAQQELPLG
jgi:short subunit dehydrogenase-like uncharacterized protein